MATATGDVLQGKWHELKGKAKQKWGKLTDDDLTVIGGKKDQLTGILQKRYGMAKDRAERELDEFTRSLEEA